MKTRFRMFRRGNYFWSHDGETGKQETLRTKDKATALRLLHSKNEAYQQPILNLQIARTYLTASDPEIGKRTWQTVMNEIVLTKKNATRVRWTERSRTRRLTCSATGPRSKPVPSIFWRRCDREPSPQTFISASCIISLWT
jgi:hypothetical protein